WTPATHTMEVVQGTNFLSVTLLPCLTVGPQGPAGPQGLPGLPGTAATVTVDRTTTVAPGTPASVMDSGTSSAAVLNFTIPQGVPGPQGPSGPTGPTGPGLTSRREFRDSGTFTVPPGITRLSVELYGAGGAGSGLASPCFSGAGGGS